MSLADASRATRIRYALLAVATANAFLLYLDRICMTAVVDSDSFKHSIALSGSHMGTVKASFFYAYALGQLPAGWLAGRFGTRRMLVVYIVLWSICTALTGFMNGLITLVAVRLVCGVAEAGAYPASARVIALWFPYAHRARASSVVAFGGRLGGSLAPALTAAAIVALGSWRPVLWIYGAFGCVLALLTWIIFRDDPESHPWANEEERQLIRAGLPAPRGPVFRFPWRELLRHRGLWLLSLGSVGMNLGWALLIFNLGAYFKDVRGLDHLTANFYVTMVLSCGMVGMLFGGWWCDWLTRRFGPRWGRRLPFFVGSATAVTAYLLCPILGSPVTVAIACACVAIAADSMIPAVWSLCQDIGGNQSAITLGWANMWGNLGAGALADIIPWVLARSWRHADWREVFWFCAGGFVLLAICVCFVDGTRRLCPDESGKVPGQ